MDLAPTSLFGALEVDAPRAYPTFNVSDLTRLTSSTSKGNQVKWYDSDNKLFIKGPFINEGVRFKDYICEEAATRLGKQLGFNVVPANICFIVDHSDRMMGSFTKNFLVQDEQFISFMDIVQWSDVPEFLDDFASEKSIELKLASVLYMYEEYCKLDASDYLFEMISLDFLIGNEDRHFNNFGAIYSSNSDSYRTAPLFDHGLSMFEHGLRYLGLPFVKCLPNMQAKPFSYKLEEAYRVASDYFGKSLAGKSLSFRGIKFPSEKALMYVKYSANVMGIQLDEGGALLD